jgi:hypothetical protein
VCLGTLGWEFRATEFQLSEHDGPNSRAANSVRKLLIFYDEKDVPTKDLDVAYHFGPKIGFVEEIAFKIRVLEKMVSFFLGGNCLFTVDSINGSINLLWFGKAYS